MKCANHLDKEAVAVCNHCGKSICPDCQVQVKNENYCKDCVGVVAGEVKKEEHSPVLAALLSFIIAGLGQIYNGQIGKGLWIFFTWWLIIPWLIGIFDAYKTAKAIKEGKIAIEKKPGCLIAAVVGMVASFFGFFFIFLLAAIAIPNLLRARLNAGEAAAQQNLRTISVAIETYRSANSGNYPLNEQSLTESTPPYLPAAYNNATRYGYIFSEAFRADGYKVIASPVECGVTGRKIFSLETGGILSFQECRERED